MSSSSGKHVRWVLSVLMLFATYVVIRWQCDKLNDGFPPHLLKYITVNEIKEDAIDIDKRKLKLKLQQLNLKLNITNLDKYKASVQNSPHFLIQVHRDIQRLQYLIMSLAQVTGIQTSLLIFSHSFYDESINRLVLSIDFCKVVQIFYPHSLQLNPHRFPGVDPNDCSPEEKNTKASCQRRHAPSTEHKQHWWWKANFVFERMPWLHRYEAPIIFLEENNYVAPGILLMSQFAQKSLSYYPHAEILSFGRPLTRNIDMDLLTIQPWRPPFDIGLAFNVTTWRKILSLSGQYCMYDDSSWSYSLLNVFLNFPKGYVGMVGCVTPRVLSTKEFTNMKESFKIYTKMFTSLDIYPKRVKSVFLFGPEGVVERAYDRTPSGNGGWSDLRDQILCLDPLTVTTTSEPRYYDADFTKEHDVE